jgi:8-oxo-dGTP pyrophosphatase MutT (NUDIX family)
MAGEVITVYAGEQPPDSWEASVFIGSPGQSPDPAVARWQIEATALLRRGWAGDGRLVVFTYEPDANDHSNAARAEWFDHVISTSDVVMSWWPDVTASTLASLAAWHDSQRVVHGAPAHLPHGSHFLEYASRQGMATATTLAELVTVALGKIGSGARRAGGEREVPLAVWRTRSFQRWYSAQTSAGNTLLGARQVWTLSTGPRKQFVLYWALHVRIHIRAEGRIKSNEVVISRPDISVLALYKPGASFEQTTVVLVREFRSPASTPDGMVHELPSGSRTAPTGVLATAVAETEEETGLAIDVRRIRAHGSRQLAGTLSAHHAHLFAAEITDDELTRLRDTCSRPHGTGASERTWVEINTVGQIRENGLVDWATLGMITEAVLGGGTTSAT